MNTKSVWGFGLIVVIITTTVSILSIGTSMMTHAQGTSSQENVTGTQNVTGINCNEADDKDEKGEVPGEDDNEPGDIDLNDVEDSC